MLYFTVTIGTSRMRRKGIGIRLRSRTYNNSNDSSKEGDKDYGPHLVIFPKSWVELMMWNNLIQSFYSINDDNNLHTTLYLGAKNNNDVLDIISDGNSDANTTFRCQSNRTILKVLRSV